MSETKTIDTLVEDIYNLVDTGKKNPDQEALFALGSSIVEAVRRQLWMATSDSPGRLRMSNIGKPCSRSLWYDINGDEQAEKFNPQTRLKFMIGDIVEAFLIYLAKEAGHRVSNQQAEIEMDGIKGHIDCFIDDELVDIKSASSFAMKKFKNGTLPDDDPFGYISQMSGYGNALDKNRGTFLAFDKSSGELATYTHSQLENTKLKIKEVKEAVELPEPPDRCFETVKDRQTGRQKLGVNCSYCSHKHTCWDGELDLKFRSGRPVFFVGKGEENVHSF